MISVPSQMSASRHSLQIWSSYDAEADTLYINFKKPSHATDSEMTDDDILVRYEGEEVVGLTVLHASKRRHKRTVLLACLRKATPLPTTREAIPEVPSEDPEYQQVRRAYEDAACRASLDCRRPAASQKSLGLQLACRLYHGVFAWP